MNKGEKEMDVNERTRKYEESDTQKKRVNRFLDFYASKKYLELEDKDEEIALPYNDVLARCDVNKTTLYQNTYPAEINTYAGARFEGGRGNKSLIFLKPETYLRNRGKLEHVEQLGGGNWERYVFENEIKGSSGDE